MSSCRCSITLWASSGTGFFAIMIPVLAFVFVPTSIAIAGDTSNFLERAAKIQFGLMVCAYCLSHAPALLLLKIPGYEGQDARLLLYLVIVDQMSDVLQFVWGKLIGRNKIAWRVSPNKTWEGFARRGRERDGDGRSAVVGHAVYAAAVRGNVVHDLPAGLRRSLVMSAMKRDIGIKDFGG